MTRKINQKQRFNPKQIKVKKKNTKNIEISQKNISNAQSNKNMMNVLHEPRNTKHKGDQNLSNKRHGFVHKPI
jgi:hypothetical protein